MSTSTNDEAAPTAKPEIAQHSQLAQDGKPNLRQRLKHFTFAWFLSTMSTGGLAIAIGDTPHQFHGQYYIGLTLFLLNIALFTLLTLLTLLRCIYHTPHFLLSFTHPAESFFLGSFTLSTSVIIGGAQTYAITHGPRSPWLVSLIHALFWLYTAVSLVAATAQYYILICSSTVRPILYSPSIFLAGYSAMLTGTLASLILPFQPPERVVAVLVAGVAYQGFGWCVSFVAIVFYLRSLLDLGLPPRKLRPGMFIPVGSCAYTVVALVGMARSVPEHTESGYFARHPSAPEVLRVLALFSSVFLYAFAIWLFAIALLANIGSVGRMPFSLSWWAFIFPNVGFTLATSALGKELESEAILWVASGMTVLLVVVWVVAAVGCVRAVWKGDIVWPGKDEDKDR